MENKIPLIIEKEFNAKTLEIKRINEGYSHYMYSVKIDKEPFEVIVRFSNNKKSEFSLSKERYVIETLRKNNIPAPKIQVYNEEYMILEKLKDLRLDTIWDSLSKQEQIQITIEIGRLLKKIHSIKLKDFGKIIANGEIEADKAFNFRDMGEKVNYNLFLRQWLLDHFEDFARLSSYPHLSKEFLTKVFEYIIHNLDKITYNGQPTLIHGDFMTGHVFVRKINDKYEITGLIDFEFALSYSPDYDFIKLHRQGFLQNNELKQALIQGYGPINEPAVEVHRMMRDLGFAWAVLEAGNKKLSDEKIKELEEKLDKLI